MAWMPARCRRSAQASPAGPAPTTATRLPVAGAWLRSGLPAVGQGGVDDVFFDGANGDRTEAVVERARAFAQAVLRAHAAADFRQRIGFVAQRRRFMDATFARQFQPLRDAVVQRATPTAIGIAAIQAAARLLFCLGLAEASVEFAPVALLGAIPMECAPASRATGRENRRVVSCSSFAIARSSDGWTEASPLGKGAPRRGGGEGLLRGTATQLERPTRCVGLAGNT